MEIYVAALVAIISVLGTLLAVKGRRSWATIALFGLSLRLFVAIGHRYFFTLPQGAADAMAFQRVALEFSTMGCGAFFDHVDFGRSYVYSSILSEFFACVGHSPLGAQFLNCAAGTVAFVYIARATENVWGRKAATRVLWICAVLPPIIVMSAVTLRESFIMLFFSAGMVRATLSSLKLSWANMFIACSWFILAGLLHSGMFAAIPGLILARTFHQNNSSQRMSKISGKMKTVRNILITCLTLLPLYPLLLQLQLNKVGALGDVDISAVSTVIENRAEGNAAYLSGLSINSLSDIIWQAPLRMFYFIFSPLPWDIRSPSHVFAISDAWLYFFVLALAFRYRSKLLNNNSAWTIFVVVGVLILVFSMGTSNFATGMRHRSKFAPWLLAAGAPLLFRSWRNLMRSRQGKAPAGKKDD